MIKVEYEELSKKSLENYYSFLIGKFYKILPLREQGCQTLKSYLTSLSNELIGHSWLLNDLKYEPMFISLLNILQFFIHEDCDIKTYKSEVFRAIRLIQDIQNKYFINGGDYPES